MVQHPLVERYVTRLETELRSLACPESQDIVDEIRNHIAEASAVGRPLDVILEALGPADILARAYAVELALNPRDRRVRAFTKFIQLAGLVAVTSLGALIVVGGLGLVGIGFSVSGLVMFVIGGLESADIHLPGVQMNGISPVWAIAFGPVVIFVGLATLAVVRAYIRFTVGTWRRVLPRGRALSSAAGRSSSDRT